MGKKIAIIGASIARQTLSEALKPIDTELKDEILDIKVNGRRERSRVISSDQHANHDVSFMHGMAGSNQVEYREVKRFDGRNTPKKKKRKKR